MYYYILAMLYMVFEKKNDENRLYSFRAYEKHIMKSCLYIYLMKRCLYLIKLCRIQTHEKILISQRFFTSAQIVTQVSREKLFISHETQRRNMLKVVTQNIS